MLGESCSDLSEMEPVGDVMNFENVSRSSRGLKVVLKFL